MGNKITEKDRIVWELLRDKNFRVNTKKGIVQTLLLPRCKSSTGTEWRTVGTVSASRNGTKKYLRYRYKGIQIYVHRIIWAARHGFLCPFKTINHKNLNGLDNRDVNLELILPSANARHAREIYRRTGMSAAETRANWKNNKKTKYTWEGKQLK